MKQEMPIVTSIQIADCQDTDLKAGESFIACAEFAQSSAEGQETRGPIEHVHDFSHEEIAYGAFCIFQEEQRQGKYSGQDGHWFMAINRLKKI